MFNGIKVFRASVRRDTYEPVEARVVDSSLETGSSRTGGTSTKYIPKVTYEYTVGGETYTSDNLYPGPAMSGSSAKDEQQAILDNYPEGSTVEAYYDPTDLGDAFLENESRKQQAVFLGLVGSFLAFRRRDFRWDSIIAGLTVRPNSPVEYYHIRKHY